MKREGTLEKLTDGNLYTGNDLAKLGCNECEGCSACCRGMGNSIVLTPLDVVRISRRLCCTAEQLLKSKLSLSVVDGLILPSLRMEGEEEKCPFLSEAGRCTIHADRPDICRLFPLGRYYENGTSHYVLMTGECKKENRSKVKIRKWMGIDNLKEYEEFILDWHTTLERFRKGLSELKESAGNPEEWEKNEKLFQMFLLKKCYLEPYGEPEMFFEEIRAREKTVLKIVE